ncbi:MAG TPA: carboxymuconolactone decarboxylase family protein [Acidimicrobiia bacterium]
MVLRVAWRTSSVYEWEQHTFLAERFGVTREDIDAIAGAVDADFWTPLEAAR